MSHHFVTVCVVCVLCAAHNPCSAHTEISTAGQKVHNAVNSENSPKLNEQLQPSWLLMKFKKLQEKDNMKLNLNNLGTYKSGAVKFSNSELNNSNVNEIPTLLVPSTIDEVHTKRKTTLQDVKVDKNVEDTRVPETEENYTTLKDLEIMERLGQTEISYNRGLKSSRSTKNPNLVTVIRRKRNVDVIDEKYFMKKIFETYGDGTSVTIEGFEKLLRKLGLLRLLTGVSKLEDLNAIASHENPLEKSKNMQNSGLSEYENGIRKERCLNSKELLSTVARDMPYNSITNNNTTLPSWLFERVCPALVYQLAGESSSERNGCILVPENYKPVIVTKYLGEDVSRNMVQVWAYSVISILIISLCGLFGVAVIPFMGKIYYHQLLQFLVALAVGTLCGDALIHLLPHAMMPHHTHDHHGHDDNDHTEIDHKEQHNINMWKGVVAMAGLVLFFFTEKALTLVAEWRKLRQRRNKLPSRVRVMRETDGPNSNVVGEKLCKHKYSSYPYCYGEINTDAQDNHHNRQHNNHEKPPVIDEEKPLTSNCNSVSKIMTNDGEKKSNEDWRLDDSIVNTKKNTDGADIPLNKSESYTVIIREHETKHHGHTHSHGHVHSAPESLSSVAWMVVMGDGLHNFTDGMAIGAAFSANIAGGFSTAIAVFCHELPHEIGDFAVLLKAGMSAKQAVFYNLLSSVLCLFGMVFGVLLGSTPAVSSWMFAAAAGMFIYIALVDMIPELSSSHSAERSSQWQCILQGLGLSCGLGIMLIIALYEHDLKTMFSD